MVALPRRQRLNLPLAPLIAGVVAIAIALVFALLPARMLGYIVLDSGIASLVPAAEPPLGVKARAALILIGGGGIGLMVWFTAYLLLGTRTLILSGKGNADGAVPVLRRADAHPDAPPRRPLFANRDLGTPFLEVRAPVHAVAEMPTDEAERSVPLDLDRPLAEFDPRAIPAEPLDWFPPPARLNTTPRPPVFDAGERIETVEPTPMARAHKLPPIDPSASIHSLLDRLERSVAQAVAIEPAPIPPPVQAEGVQDALTTLRRLATKR